MKVYRDLEVETKKNNKFKERLMKVLPEPFTRKERFKALAVQNMNLAFGKNEFGEVSELRKESALQRLFVVDRYARSFEKLNKPLKAVTISVPILFFIVSMIDSHGYLLKENFLFSLAIAGMFLLLFICSKMLSRPNTNTTLAEIVNSKVVLGENYIEYSYSTVNPKRTEGDPRANFVVKRMMYSDIKDIVYYDKSGYCEVKGVYNYTKYYNYKIGQENPIYREEKREGGIVLFDVYTDRDLFAEISKKANFTPRYGVEKKRSPLAVSFWTLGFIGSALVCCSTFMGIILIIITMLT